MRDLFMVAAVACSKNPDWLQHLRPLRLHRHIESIYSRLDMKKAVENLTW